jgi:zinc transport system ATP-binding protein
LQKSQNPLIKYNRVRITVNSNSILSDVDLEINSKDYVAFFGANGSGKSTLIKATLGMIPIETGKIEVAGERIHRSATAANVIQNSVGYVPQYSDISRDFPITVREVLKLECEGDSCHRDITEHLDILNAGKIIDQKISELSGGEFQKMLISRALIKEPEVLILDEPVNNLDQKSKEDLFSKLKKLNVEQGKTIILVSHDHNLIEENDIRVFKFIDNTVKEWK